jgi:DNA-binding NarL/FixJ family response regulator
MQRVRVLLADDHTILREGLQRLLESEIEIVGHADDGVQVVEKALFLRPDVIVMDISMPRMTGFEAARQIRKSWPEAKIVFLTVHRDPRYADEAYRSGGTGYVLKRAAASELLSVIQRVAKGGSHAPAIGPDHAPDLMHLPGSAAIQNLTSRHLQILQLLAEGRSLKETAAILSISQKTVEFHRARLLEKLCLKTTAQLIRFAVEQGIVDRITGSTPAIGTGERER